MAPDIVDLYLAGLAASTRRVAAGDLRTLASMSNDVSSWASLATEQAADIRRQVVERYAPGTANRMLSHLRGVLRAAWRSGALPFDAQLRLLATLPAVRGGRVGKGRALPWDDVQRLLRAAHGPEERALLALAAGAGLRRAELCALTWDRCVDSGGTWHVTVLGKGNRERRMRLPGWASSELRDWWSCAPRLRRPHVFRWRDGKSVWGVVYDAAERAGVGHLSPHDLRRTFASLALASGISLADLRRMMGHASITTTVKYDKRPDADVDRAAEKLDDPGGVDTRRGTR